MLLSLISGRNPDLLIGHHVIAAPKLKESDLEIIPTGYVLIDGGIERRRLISVIPGRYRQINLRLPPVLRWQVKCWVLKLIYLEAGRSQISCQ